MFRKCPNDSERTAPDSPLPTQIPVLNPMLVRLQCISTFYLPHWAHGVNMECLYGNFSLSGGY